ncbi:MAG: response regulator transcription factor [Oceanicoccus sp.]
MRVLIVDDHQLIRSAVRNLLVAEFPGVECIEVDNGLSALEIAAHSHFDVAIVDLFLPNETAFVLVRNLCDLLSDLPVLILSATDNKAHMLQCFELGVSAFVNKGEAIETIVDAVKVVLSGEKYLPEILSAGAVLSSSVCGNDLADRSLDEVIRTLTNRQLDILRLVAQGQSNKEIARDTNLSDNTVKVHVSAILRALDLSNRTQIGLLAQKIGILNSL